MAQRQLKTGYFINETGSNQYQLPGGGYVNETSGGGGGASQSIAFTLEDIAAAVSQNLSHDQSLTGTLDGVTVSISQTAQHSQALSATLDDVTVAISQTLGNATNQTLDVTLDGVTFAASQTLGHAQSLTATLDGVTVAVSQTLSHSQALAATLDGITVAISQSAAPSSKEQALAITLDGVDVSINQAGPAPLVANGFVMVDRPSTLWWKRKPKALTEEAADQKVKRVVRVIEQIARKQQPEKTAKQAQREVAQAIAPLLEEMPGFDWTPIYRTVIQEMQRQQQEEAARIEAVIQIERIRAIEQDDEDVLFLLMSL